MIKIRQALPEDVIEITQLFYDTIQHINIRDYTQEEVDDWSYWKSNIDRWLLKIKVQYFIVAVKNDKIIGFGSITFDGNLDLLYVDKDIQNQGIASLIYNELYLKALQQNNLIINSEVSLTAYNFFKNKGFIVQEKQLKKSRNKELINFKMIKYL